MHRRDVLRLLATGTVIPASSVDLLFGPIARVGDDTLNRLQGVTMALASSFKVTPSALLLDPVTAHLENACRLLKASMRRGHQQRLHAVIADAAAFAGHVSFNAHKPGHAAALFGLAQEHARQAGNPVLLAEVLADGCWLHSAMPSGGRSGSKEALALLEEADRLATKYAAPTVKARTATWLAEERAAAKDAAGADEAFERAQRALQEAGADGFTGWGFHSTVGLYAGLDEPYVEGFQGIADILLGRNVRAIETLSVALAGAGAPTRRRACVLTDLGDALAGDGHPEEAGRRLVEAYTLCDEHDYAMGRQRIRGVRARFEPAYASLPTTRKLDDLLPS